ncbi:MAG: fibronectin type III domain-containing protein, partial [Saprospiraceae bacterium]|nr:fibronectin type III domain-containing protein [Saprospiraceae bacterium]
MHQFINALESLALLLLAMHILFACKQAPEHNHQHPSVNLHYSDYGPYLFPSKHPDQVILNLTENPLRGVAVNWRTDTTVHTGSAQVSEATHGPEFRDHARTIMGSTDLFTNKYGEEPEVSAHFHSAIIDGLVPGMTYVYRVGIDTVWSEWFQIKIPDVENDGVSFIYFGDAQNEVKSMWSRVIRKAYSTMPEVDFMLHAGDLINRSNRDLEWAEWFYAGA